ncbi:hypothetical protein E6O75_ATG04278 [Venturia nashicola]|uniref:polynucleotide adenylyltransferase n=1 Tax=Venturia nashicola TaxID=86259 RepID=A0A4Z1P7G0_9PEZI|nr:hypothetical protein E6O75_ATG04278 [Venturia nashicola]
MTDSYRGSRYNGDSYQPRHRSRSRSPRRDDMYRFGGSNNHSRGDHYDGSNYGRGDFSFRNESHQAQWPAASRADHSRPSRNSNRNRNGTGNRGGRGGRWPTRGSKAANERKILNTGMSRDITPERLEGMTQGALMFNPDQEESDSDPDEDSEKQDDSEEGPSKKRVRIAQTEADDNEKPKWSNPDPYYSLPPVIEDTNAKKKDVVELIRKAKVAAEKDKEDATNAVAQNDDFISFAMDEDEGDHISISSDNSSDIVEIQPPVQSSAASNTVPFSHLTNFHPLLAKTPASTGVRPTPNNEVRREGDTWPPRTNHEAVNRPQQRDTLHKQHGSKRKRNDSAGDLARDWAENRYERAVPWLKEDYSDAKSTAIWLHKEICDFYDFVKPTQHEHAIRQNCVDRIASALSREYPDSDLRSFGSYAYGIYLPTADMDLVLISRRYQQTGIPDFYPNLNRLQKVLNALRKAGITADHGSQVIAKAKVPIVKFVDRLTGLHVDISFENITGITALSSFDSWKAQYPQFTVLVTLIKQFLLMRDLNEVHTGGLGGFSVACLVVSMLQHSPDIQSGNPPTLGALLLRFFKLYGSDFNMTSLGISVNPPKYIPKDVYSKSYGKAKWLIHDPHNADNDVSGGSSRAELIADKFYDAYHILRDLMDLLGHAGPTIRKGRSILHPIFGGNYQSFVDQREQLLEVYDRMRVQGYFS